MLRTVIIGSIIAIILYYIYVKNKENKKENFYSDVVTAAPFDLILNDSSKSTGSCMTPAQESCLDNLINESWAALPLSEGSRTLPSTDVSIYRPKLDTSKSQLMQESAGRDDKMYHGIVRRVPILPTIDAPGCSVNFIPQENCLTTFDSFNRKLYEDPADSTLRSRKEFIDSGNGETLMRRSQVTAGDIPLGHSISNMPDISSAFVQLKLLGGCKEIQNDPYNLYGGQNISILQTGGRVMPSTKK